MKTKSLLIVVKYFLFLLSTTLSFGQNSKLSKVVLILLFATRRQSQPTLLKSNNRAKPKILFGRFLNILFTPEFPS